MWLLLAMAILLCGRVVAVLLLKPVRPEIFPGWAQVPVVIAAVVGLHSGDSGFTGRPG